MQPITKLAFFDIADKAINARQRLGGATCLIQPQISFDTKRARLVADIGLQPVTAIGIKPVSI